MAKKNLRSGLDGWIKETKKSHDRLADGSPVESASPGEEPSTVSAPESVELRRLPIDALDVGSPSLDLGYGDDDADLDRLAQSIARHGQWQPVVARGGSRPTLVSGFRRLAALERLAATEVLVLIHPHMSAEDATRFYVADNLHRLHHPEVLRRLSGEHGVERLVDLGVPPSWFEVTAEPAPTLLDGIVAVDDAGFEREVLNSDIPVLVGVHLPGHVGSAELQAALIEAGACFAGELKVCAVDIMQSDGPAIPQLVKVGRGFLEKHLPRVQLYAGGWRLGELSPSSDDAIDAQTLAEWLGSELG